MKGIARQPLPVVEPKPSASAMIEPCGPRTQRPRPHALRVLLRFTGIEPKFTDRSWVLAIAKNAIESAQLDHEAPTFGEVRGKMEGSVIGIEAAMICATRPDAAAIEQLRHVLVAAGYGFSARALRECDEEGCTTTADTDCARPTATPPQWFDTNTCGRHGYKRCGRCSSTYVMSCENAINAAPSLHCEVCGEILIEWGSTKRWTAELARRAEWPSVAKA